MQLQHQDTSKNPTTANYVILNESNDRKHKQHQEAAQIREADVNEKLTKLFDSINANKNNYSSKQELNDDENILLANANRPFKITPLLICTKENNNLSSNHFNNNNKISITKNICNCNFCLLNLAYLNKNCFSHLSSESGKQHEELNFGNKFNLIDFIDLNTKTKSSNNYYSRRNSFICTADQQQSHSGRHRSSTPQITQERVDEEELVVKTNEKEEAQFKCLGGGGGEDPIIYIDSLELDEHLANSNSNMNSFLEKLKSKHRHSTIFTEKQQRNTTNSKNTNHKSTGNHDYHVIDEHIDENATITSKVPPAAKCKVSPSNSVQSFEFIDHTQPQPQHTVKCHLDESVKSYEKSWENSASFLMEKLDKCLKQEQQQHLENRVKIIEQNKNCTQCSTTTPATTNSSSYYLSSKSTLIPIKSITPIKLNCSMRERKLNALCNLNCSNLNRKSFHGQACLNEMNLIGNNNNNNNTNGFIVNNQQKYVLNSPKFTSLNTNR